MKSASVAREREREREREGATGEREEENRSLSELRDKGSALSPPVDDQGRIPSAEFGAEIERIRLDWSPAGIHSSLNERDSGFRFLASRAASLSWENSDRAGPKLAMKTRVA